MVGIALADDFGEKRDLLGATRLLAKSHLGLRFDFCSTSQRSVRSVMFTFELAL